ncbi:MAG: hypothetical protein WKF71_09645 [Pyrinomonadaceae bacterium]|jgi:hypothetical protein
MKVLPLVGTELRSAIIGMVAGDAGIRQQKGCKSVSLRIHHAERQKEYLEYKRDILQNLFREWEITVKPFNNSGYPGVRLATRTHPRLRTVYKWFYKNGKKQFSRSILNYLTPNGIALWYMDDGSLSYKKRDGLIHGREIHLNTYCSFEEAEIIQTYFKDVWNMSWTLVSNKGFYRLRMGAGEAQKLFAMIDPYIVPCMRYKLDLKYKSTSPLASDNFFVKKEVDEIVHTQTKVWGKV